MKDIYRTMASQNILKFYGSKLDLKLDYSELYDFEISKTENDYDSDLLDLTTPITYTELAFNSSCMTGTSLNSSKPVVMIIGTGETGNTCSSIIKRRPDRGWTLDFVFNKNGLNWISGSTFYYWGISGETNQNYFADNNLSFSFTTDGRIKWESYHYSGICDTVSGYSETYYISSGQTPVLCTNAVVSDFNITITFERNLEYSGCEVENEGGWNDLILGPHPISFTGTTGVTSTQITTGYTITDSIDTWLTGSTITEEFVEELNKKWFNERYKRLGTLKIYLNGRPIYKLKNWEEIIPSNRESINEIVQIFGGGTTGYLDIHTGNTQFDLLQVKYFEEPLKFPYVRHHYITSIKPNFTTNECKLECDDVLESYVTIGILQENGSLLLTEDGNVLIY